MTSGIYKLTFPSGNFYIGKSNDIEKRWKQHIDKFNKGKHTRLMQSEFDIYREYLQEVLFEIHEDHIDLVEEMCIARLKPSLNGTKCIDRLECVDDSILQETIDYFSVSTIDHLRMLREAKYEALVLKGKLECALDEALDTAESYEFEVNQLISQLDAARKLRSAEELQADISASISTLNAEVIKSRGVISGLNHECTRLNKECQTLLEYKKLPWYKKIFS